MQNSLHCERAACRSRVKRNHRDWTETTLSRISTFSFALPSHNGIMDAWRNQRNVRRRFNLCSIGKYDNTGNTRLTPAWLYRHCRLSPAGRCSLKPCVTENERVIFRNGRFISFDLLPIIGIIFWTQPIAGRVSPYHAYRSDTSVSRRAGEPWQYFGIERVNEISGVPHSRRRNLKRASASSRLGKRSGRCVNRPLELKSRAGRSRAMHREL